MGKFVFLLLVFIGTSLLITGFGCDGIEKVSERNAVQLAEGDLNVPFDCNKRKELTCQSGTEYCVRSTMGLDRNWYKTAECIAKPKGCNACGCTQEDAKVYYSMAKNCKGEVHCRFKNSQIVVTCFVPEGATNLDEEPSRNFVNEKPSNS